MKLGNIGKSEIGVASVYEIRCFMCDTTLYIDFFGAGGVSDASKTAASQGWHSYETSTECCSSACPSCIKEVQENERDSA